MRTTLASFCVLGLLMGCERRGDQDATAELDRPSSDSAVVSGAIADTSANASLTWGPPPPGLPAGARGAIVKGDPSKGPFTARLDMPDGYEVRPHTHPTSERLRVIEGTVKLGTGKQWDDGKLKPLAKDEEMNIGPREPHFLRAQGRTIVEVESSGAFQITYVNSADDPRNPATK
jgi:mannose-6-phosphate isomerase-like protein (cupin superfamily)